MHGYPLDVAFASTKLPRRQRQMEPFSLASCSRRPPDPAPGREAVKGTWTGYWLAGSSIDDAAASWPPVNAGLDTLSSSIGRGAPPHAVHVFALFAKVSM